MSNQRALWLPLCAALLLALFSASTRLALERSYSTVELCADYDEVRGLAAFSGVPLVTALGGLRAAGLSAVALEEPSVRDLLGEGRLEAVSPPAARSGQALVGGGTTLVTTGADSAADTALQTLAQRYGGLPVLSGLNPIRQLSLAIPLEALLDAGAGLDPSVAKTITGAGLLPVARPRNSPGLDSLDLQSLLGDLAKAGFKQVVFAGDQVLGFRPLVPETANQLVRAKLVWGRVEFATQRGEERLAEELLRGAGSDRPAESYLRAHGISAPELAKLSPEMVIERYRRAAQERGIRLIFVRLPQQPAGNPLAEATAYVRQIGQAITASGLSLGSARPLPMFRPPLWLSLGLALLGVLAPAAWLLAWAGGNWTPRAWLLWWLGLAVPTLALFMVKPELAASGSALLAGLVYPTLAGRRAWLALEQGQPRTTWGAIGLLWSSVGLVVIGGLVTAGLLAYTSYYLHHDAFAGVKLAHLVPLVLVGAMVVSGWSLPKIDLRAARLRLAGFWSAPVSAGHIIIAGAALLAVAVMLVRSGNEGADVSGLELRFRAILEHVLIARPRTKEFLVGYPALLLAGLAVARGRRVWAGPLLLLGMVGLVGAFNTFCHLHSPLLLGLLRTFHALWMGTLLGLVSGWLLWPRRRQA